MSPLHRAVEIAGGQAALADGIKVSRQVLNNWVRGRVRVPAEHCPAIERATGGQVRCEELRPDVAWDVVRRGVAA